MTDSISNKPEDVVAGADDMDKEIEKIQKIITLGFVIFVSYSGGFIASYIKEDFYIILTSLFFFIASWIFGYSWLIKSKTNRTYAFYEMEQ